MPVTCGAPPANDVGATTSVASTPVATRRLAYEFFSTNLCQQASASAAARSSSMPTR